MAPYKLSEYEQARLDKIKRNEARLKSLGLDDAKKRVKNAARKRKSTTKTPSNKRPRRVSASPTSPTRSSRRLKKKPVQYEPLMDDDLDIQLARKKFKQVKKQTRVHTANTNFKCEIPNGVISSPLSNEEKKLIERKMKGDFLAKFEVCFCVVFVLSVQVYIDFDVYICQCQCTIRCFIAISILYI